MVENLCPIVGHSSIRQSRGTRNTFAWRRPTGVFGLNRGWYEDPSQWRTLNQFFARRLKSADQRPIAAPADESIVVSPVDAIPQGIWGIDNTSRVVEKSGITVKTGTVQSVEQLIGGQSRYKGAFAGGHSLICFSTSATITTITFRLAV